MNKIRLEYSRFPLGATVVGVSVTVISLYSIIMVSYVLANFGYYLREDCNYIIAQGNKSHFGIISAIQEIIKQSNKAGLPDSFLEWIDTFEITQENCLNIIKPFLGALVAWDVIISFMFIFSILMVLGVLMKNPMMLIPFLMWLALIIIFVFSAVIAIATRLSSRHAALVITCTVIFLMIPVYYWVIAFLHQREATLANEIAPASQVTTLGRGTPVEPD